MHLQFAPVALTPRRSGPPPRLLPHTEAWGRRQNPRLHRRSAALTHRRCAPPSAAKCAPGRRSRTPPHRLSSLTVERRARLRQSSVSLRSGASQLPQPFLSPCARAEATRAQTTFAPAAGRALTTAVACNIRHYVAGLGFRKGYTTLPRRLRQVLAHGGGARFLVQTWYLRLVVRYWSRGMAQFHELVDTRLLGAVPTFSGKREACKT